MDIKQLFTIPNSSNSHYAVPTNTYDFINRKQRTLCVTVGDSWTYGSDLDDRMDVYGNQLSVMLDADWLNLSWPGCGNFFMGQLIHELSNAKLDYDNVYIFCTLTETGRLLDSSFDRHIDFLDLSNNGYYNLFKQYEQWNIDYINSCSPAFTNIIIGSNFVERFDDSQPTWLSLLTDYDDKCHSVFFGLDNIARQIPDILDLNTVDKFLFKEFITKWLTKGMQRQDILQSCSQIKNHHPCTKNAHRLWALEMFNRLA